jgi:hypothetical protein
LGDDQIASYCVENECQINVCTIYTSLHDTHNNCLLLLFHKYICHTTNIYTLITRPPSNDEILKSIKREITLFYYGDADNNTSSSSTSYQDESAAPTNQKPRFLVCETAGGVLTPGPNKTLQADVYRPLRLPVLLVGDAKLGGGLYELQFLFY